MPRHPGQLHDDRADALPDLVAIEEFDQEIEEVAARRPEEVLVEDDGELLGGVQVSFSVVPSALKIVVG